MAICMRFEILIVFPVELLTTGVAQIFILKDTSKNLI